MHNVTLALEASWKVLVVSLILGAGLPVLFGLGVRSLAWGAGGDAEVHESGVTGPTPRPIGKVLAWVLFVIILFAVFCGIFFIVATGLGKGVSFEHVYPTIVDK